MQNSGLGLSIDSIIGTFHLYSEGCLIFISNRGKITLGRNTTQKMGRNYKKTYKNAWFLSLSILIKMGLRQ